MSKMTQIENYEETGKITMSFVEFLEFICRLADSMFKLRESNQQLLSYYLRLLLDKISRSILEKQAR